MVSANGYQPKWSSESFTATVILLRSRVTAAVLTHASNRLFDRNNTIDMTQRVAYSSGTSTNTQQIDSGTYAVYFPITYTHERTENESNNGGRARADFFLSIIIVDVYCDK